MSIWKQSVLSLALCLGAVLGMAALVPQANAALRGIGLGPALDLVGLAAQEAAAGGGPGGAGGGPRGGGGPAQVVAALPGEGQVADRVTAIGDGRALRSVVVAPETPGRVVEVAVQSGQRVAAGDILLRLDSEAETIALERARLVRDDARAALERLSQLQGSGASTAVQLREAELALRQAELEVRQAEFDLSLRAVPAPVAGWIGIVGVEVGAQVGTATEIARIDDRSALLVEFRLPERLVGRIAPGDAVTAEALAGGFPPITGRVSAVDNSVDPASRTLRVQARLENAEDRLRAGMSFLITVDLPGVAAPTVHPLSVQWNRDGAFVWVVREGKAARLPIRILQRSEAEVRVEAAFAPGDLVVVEGVQAVRPGAEVEVVGAAEEMAAEVAP